jgi:hypothetical protein
VKITPTGKRVSIDLVVTSAPSEMQVEFIRKSLDTAEAFRIDARGDARANATLTEDFTALRKSAAVLEQWQREPLKIPSRDLKLWEPTHPLEQIRWTIEKNGLCGGNYLGTVRTFKWWRKRYPDGEFPKGYPLEHIVGINAASGADSVALLVTTTFESIRDAYRGDMNARRVPFLPDHGVPTHNVFARITPDQFATFWRLIDRAAAAARAAYEAQTIDETAARWRSLLGPEFKEPPKGGGFVPPRAPAQPVSGGRFG